MGHKSSLNFSLTPGNALEFYTVCPGKERESAAQRDVIWVCDVVLERGSKLPLLCLLLHIYRCIGLIEKRQHGVQRSVSSLPLGVKQR
jgi:hypothetical protein